MQAPHPITIDAYQPTDLDAVIAIFQAAIREVASRDYTAAQVDAWAQVDRERWAAARSSRPTWIARTGITAIGFADLEPDGHLDMMFVHPAHQSVGVASALLNAVEASARAQNLSRLFTEASITARPFFEKRGFLVTAAQTVEKRGQHLRNYRMTKSLE